jgi:hypothetical protein
MRGWLGRAHPCTGRLDVEIRRAKQLGGVGLELVDTSMTVAPLSRVNLQGARRRHSWRRVLEIIQRFEHFGLEPGAIRDLLAV